MADRILTNLGRVSLFVGAAGIVPYSCLYDVDGGERAVMFNRFGGVGDKVIGEGTHFILPWFQIPYIYDIRTRPKTINTTTGTKDLQTVSLTLRLLFRPRTERLPAIHQTLGPDYEERVLPSIGNEVLKAVVARYNAESLLTQRDEVSNDIRQAILTRASQFDIILDDVAITHLAYGKEFSRAIEDKQVAQQEAERLKFVVIKAEHEKEAAIIRAEGEAEAADRVSNALREHGSGIIEVRRIDAQKDIAVAMSRSSNVSYIPAGNGANVLMNMQK